jgi:hypothetical protein
MPLEGRVKMLWQVKGLQKNSPYSQQWMLKIEKLVLLQQRY